ncbi:MAG: prepilin-type N-terminal cleavage/methylation domain-containing protein [Tenericutes bacterium]|nr:prepilin-type N-terminal cleavage/methylation domain-containing protein [Mycoplasmatota bacterium]
MLNKKNKGFTLIELLAVIALLAIVGITSYNIINKRLKTSKAKANYLAMKNLVKEIEDTIILEGINGYDLQSYIRNNNKEKYELNKNVNENDTNSGKYIINISTTIRPNDYFVVAIKPPKSNKVSNSYKANISDDGKFLRITSDINNYNVNGVIATCMKYNKENKSFSYKKPTVSNSVVGFWNIDCN